MPKSRKVVLVTGCSRGGIGYELCRAFLGNQCTVFATARRLESMEGLKELGCETLALDVTSEDSIKSAVAAVIGKAGSLDILVNNAGAICAGPAAEVPIEDMKANFNTNVFGAIAMVQAVTPHMVSQKGGVIVNIGSIVGYINTPFNGTYCASKAALHSFSDALRVELKPFGIKVLLVAPGSIRSNIAANGVAPLSHRTWITFAPFQKQIEDRANASQSSKSTPADIFAKKVVQVVLQSSPPAHFTYGQLSKLFSCLRWLPLWLVDKIMARKFGLNASLVKD